MDTDSDTLRDLANRWDLQRQALGDLTLQVKVLIEDNIRLDAQIIDLQAQLAALQPKPNFLFQDDFTQIPTEVPADYHVDAPSGALQVVPDGLQIKYNFSSPRNANGKAKAEMGPRLGEKLERYGRIPFFIERWHAVTITVPQEWEDDSNKVSILEFHGSEDPGEEGIGRNASLSLMIWNMGFVGWRLWSDKPIQTENEHRETIFSTPFVRDVPYRFIYRTIFDWNPVASKGETDIWIVRGSEPASLIFSERGPNAYRDVFGAYFKMGIYWPALNLPESKGKTFAVTSHRLFFSRLRVADAGAKLADLL